MRHIIILFLLVFTASIFAQTTTADVFKAKDRVEFRGYKIEQIQNDTALPSNSIMKLPTEYAVKQFVLNHLGGGSGAGGDGKIYFISAVADTNTILDPKSGDVAVVTAASKLYQYSTSWIYKSDIDLSNTNEIQTIALTGDVTGSGTGTFATTIANDAVTNAKMANMATNRLKGRSTAGTGDPEDIVVGAGLTLSAGTLSATGGGPATAGGNPTEVQVNVGGVLGTGDSIVITQAPGDRLGLGKRTGLGARLHIQSQASDESPAILIDNSLGKRIANINSYGVLALGGIVSNGATGRIELNRYSDGMTYGTIWNEEIDSIMTIIANKNGLRFYGKTTATAYMTNAGWKFGIDVYEPSHQSAIVEIDGIGDKIRGFLLPRGTTTQRNLISSPANLLLFGNTSTGKLQYYNGAWKTLMDSASVSGVYLPLAGGTLTGNLLFNPDNTYDIGTNSTSRPRSIYTGTSFETAGTGKFTFNNRGGITASSDGVFRISDNAGTSFGRLQFGGTTNAYPGIKRSGTQLQIRLADDSGNAELTAGSLIVGGTSMSGSLIADFQSTTKAFRPPVMTQTQRDAIASPPGGAMVYNTTSQKINYNTGGTWVELGTGGGTVTSIVAGSSNTTKGLSAVESPAGTYTIGLNMGSLGVISPLAASDTSTYLVAQKAIGFENSKVQIRDIVYDAYGESYQNAESNLGVLTSNVEYDLKLANAGSNKLFNYDAATGILKYNGTFSKNMICQFNGVFHSTVVGDMWVRIYTAPATGSTWTLLTQCKVYLPTIGNTANYSCRRRVTLTQGMRVKAVVMQQPTGTAFCDMGTLSVDSVTSN